jgi:homoserine kinase type II
MLKTLAGRPAAMVSFLDGVWLRRPQVQHCAAVGDSLAQLHAAGRDFSIRRANALSLAGWRELAAKLDGEADKVAPGLGDLIGNELQYLQQHWPAGLPQGVIHADLFPNNVFFLGDTLSGLIDFYFACNDSLAYDLAVCINAWCFSQEHQFEADKAAAMVAAYTARRPLQAAEVAAMPVLARGAALRFLLTRAYDWLHTSQSALVNRLDPGEYIAKLRFHQSVAGAAAYGLPRHG